MALPHFRWARAELSAEARHTALAVLSPTERERFDGTALAKRDVFLAGRLVLRALAGELTGTAPADVQLEASCPDCGGPHGRPVVSDWPLHLSLTRGAGVVVAAAAWDTPIGIDIESAAVEPARVEAIGRLTGHASVEHWTRVEAILKADGRGLRVDPSRVTVEADRGWIDSSSQRYDLSEVDLAPGVRVSVAMAG